MVENKLLKMLLPALMLSIGLTGCGAVNAQTTAAHAPMTTGSAQTGNGIVATDTTNTSADVVPGDILVGAAASPPMGMGNGVLLLDKVGTKGDIGDIQVSLAKGANAFRVAIVDNRAYVPTLQGTTYVVDLQSHKVVATFATPPGARLAYVSAADHLLIITGSKSVTAYSLPSLKQVWQTDVGGNTLAIVGSTAYLSGNQDSHTNILDIKIGKVTGTIPVGMIEDSVYDRNTHTLWLANWTSGDMTIVNAQTNQVEKVIRRNEGGGFKMSAGTMGQTMDATGGFMQLAVGPTGKYVYAASFSGNIMVYNAKLQTFAKDIPTVSGAKLSGIAVDASGQVAYTTVENLKETVAVSLTTDKVVATYPGLVANRWFVMHG